MSLARLFTKLSQKLVNHLGEVGGPRSDQVDSEINNIIDFINSEAFRTLFVDPVVRETAANTTETDLSSFTIPADTFDSDGDFMIFLTGVNFAANANTKRYRVYFNGTVIYDTTALAFNNVNLFLLSYLYRRTSAVLTGMFMSLDPGGTNTQLVDIGGQDFTVGNIIKSTGQNGTASAQDIQQFGLIIVKGSV